MAYAGIAAVLFRAFQRRDKMSRIELDLSGLRSYTTSYLPIVRAGQWGRGFRRAPTTPRPLAVELAANLTAREIAGAGVGWVLAVVRVDVDVCAARLHRRDQVRERMSR